MIFFSDQSTQNQKSIIQFVNKRIIQSLGSIYFLNAHNVSSLIFWKSVYVTECDHFRMW